MISGPEKETDGCASTGIPQKLAGFPRGCSHSLSPPAYLCIQQHCTFWLRSGAEQGWSCCYPRQHSLSLGSPCKLALVVRWSRLPFKASAFLMCIGAGFSPANHTNRAAAHSFTSLHFRRFLYALEEILPFWLQIDFSAMLQC